MVEGLLKTLNATGLAKKDPDLYQVLKGLIENQGLAKTVSSGQITTYEVDVRNSAVSIPLTAAVKGLTIFKDTYGNAAVNNITLTGTVDGIVDPVINTNFGFYHVYVNSVGLAQW